MTPTPPHLDIVSLSAFLLGMVVGPSAAAILGPYAVIVLASTGGASWAVSRRAPGDRWSAVWFFLRLVLTALLFSVGLSELAEDWVGDNTSHLLLAPIAFVIGAVGDEWPEVGRWAASRLKRLIERKVEGDSDGK